MQSFCISGTFPWWFVGFFVLGSLSAICPSEQPHLSQRERGEKHDRIKIIITARRWFESGITNGGRASVDKGRKFKVPVQRKRKRNGRLPDIGATTGARPL